MVKLSTTATRLYRFTGTTPQAVPGRACASLTRDVIAQVRVLDVLDQAVLFRAGLLISLLPFLILLSAFASQRVDDDIALRFGRSPARSSRPTRRSFIRSIAGWATFPGC